MQGVFDREIFVTPEYGMDLGRYDYANVYKDFYEKSWRQPGDNSIYPKLGHSTKNNDINTTWVQDAGYFRIKNLEIGYTLPKPLVSKVNLEQLRVYFNATNLLTLSNYVGFDPEMEDNLSRGGANYPQAITISFGVNLTF